MVAPFTGNANQRMAGSPSFKYSHRFYKGIDPVSGADWLFSQT